MIDQALKSSLNEKIRNGDFQATDIPAYLRLFCQLGNELEDLQDEVDGWNRRLRFYLPGAGQYWLVVQDGRFTTGEDAIEDVDLILTLDPVIATRIFAGETDAESAFTSGSLRIEGDLTDAIKVHELLEIVAEEIEY